MKRGDNPEIRIPSEIRAINVLCVPHLLSFPTPTIVERVGMDLWANTLRPILDHFRLFSVTLLSLSLPPPSLSLSPEATLQTHIFTFLLKCHRTIPSGQVVYFSNGDSKVGKARPDRTKSKGCPTNLRRLGVSQKKRKEP